MDEIIDYGQWSVPTRWEEVTLKQYQEIERYYEDKDKQFDVREVLHIFTDKSQDEINALPLEFLEEIMTHLLFLQTKPEEKEPRNWVEINGERYTVHTENKLRVGEYIATDTAMKGDKHNYAAILAILCRKDGEIYDSRYENEVLEDRIKLWESVPVVDVLPIVGFFLHLYVTLQTPTLLSSHLMEAIDLMRRDIENSVESGEQSKRSMKSAMRKLKKLEKSINSI
jgi:hypothetical protein